MRKIVLIILGVFLAVGIMGCSKKNETNEKVLRVGMEGTYAPYTYHDTNGTLTGFEVDVATAIGEKIGYKVEFVEGNFDTLFQGMKARDFDVIMNQISITEERLNNYNFSIPYIYTNPILIVSTDNTDISDFKDLAGKRAAQGQRTNFRQLAESYGAQIIGQDDFALTMELILSGEADLTINDKLAYAYWKTIKNDTKTKIAKESEEITSCAIIMEKGNEELLSILNTAIQELLQEGKIAEISEKYFSIDVSQR